MRTTGIIVQNMVEAQVGMKMFTRVCYISIQLWSNHMEKAFKAIWGTSLIFILSFTIFTQNAWAQGAQDLQRDKAIFGNGTLIMIVPTIKGILICADKRIYRESTGNKDTMHKIVQLGPNSAFAVSGAPIVTQRNTGRMLFNVFDIVEGIFQGRDIVDTTQTWNNLQEKLKQAFKESVLALEYKDWPESQYPQKNYILFEILFFHPGADRRPHISLLQFRYIKQPNPIVEAQTYNVTVKGSFSAFGSGHVIMELQSGTDKRFDDIRNNAKIRKFLLNLVEPKNVTVKDAMYFSKRIIEVSSSRYNLVTDIDGHISPNCDCAILRNKGGFRLLGNK
jgi:hypothetical protein